MTTNPEVVKDVTVSNGGSYLDWGAVLGGAVIAAATAFIFISFGSAIGLGVVSPWASGAASPTTVGIIAAAWFLISTALAYYFGGYVAGRMRAVRGDATAPEVETRDALHGAVVWATGALVFIWIGAATVSSVATGAAQVGTGAAQVMGSVVQSKEAGALGDYAIDKLYRSDVFNANPGSQDIRDQSARIFYRALADGELTADDRVYLVKLVAAQTSLSESEAQARVDQVFAEARAVADETATTVKETAKTVQNATLLMAFLVATGFFVSLVAAWFGAVMGGSHRDKNTVSSIFVARRPV